MIFSSWWSSAPDENCFWWSCFWWRQHFRSTLSSEPLFFKCFLLVDSIALICSFRTYALKIDTTFLTLVLHTWTNISIFNWQFLILCYHQNSKGNVKHILFQHSLHIFLINLYFMLLDFIKSNQTNYLVANLKEPLYIFFNNVIEFLRLKPVLVGTIFLLFR